MDVALLKSKCNDTPPHTTRFLGNHHDGTVGSISITGCTKILKSELKKQTQNSRFTFSKVDKLKSKLETLKLNFNLKSPGSKLKFGIF